MSTRTDGWDPEQYNRFRDERLEPLFDLLTYISPQADMSIVDLGCGTGDVTLRLVDHFAYARALGVDSSQAMLDRAPSDARLTFRRDTIEDFDDYGKHDLIFSNAALQWVPDNAALISRIVGAMRNGAQIAVQVPRNEGHVSHAMAAEVATTPPFDRWLDGYVRSSHVLAAEEYARLLHVHGCVKPVVLERVYVHVLPQASDVVEWVKGTLLTSYLTRLEPAQREEFLEAYRSRLMSAIGSEAPYVYAFRRLLFWGRKR